MNKIRVCLPKETQNFGWAVASQYILHGLSQKAEIAYPTEPKYPLLMAVRGADGLPLEYLPRGPKNVGIAFIETPSEAKRHLHNFGMYYDTLACGSSWMQLRMKEIGIQNTCVALQGVDYELFKPAQVPPSEEHFMVFSGGKFEFRKGQDIAIAAMKVFMERHKDVHFMASWMNLWPVTMRSMEASKHITYRHLSDDWRKQVLTTLKDNGIPMERVILTGDGLNADMAPFYHQCHVGLFPNRCEAGTNMVLCEAIASGMPVIASIGTGHKDIRNAVSYWLEEGSESGPDHWWSPFDIDEILTHLEQAYTFRKRAHLYGLGGAEKIRELISWEKCCDVLLEELGV